MEIWIWIVVILLATVINSIIAVTLYKQAIQMIRDRGDFPRWMAWTGLVPPLSIVFCVLFLFALGCVAMFTRD